MLLFRDTKFYISVWIVLAKVLNRLSVKEYMFSFGIIVEIIHWSWL